MSAPHPLDPALARGLTGRRIGRRAALRLSVLPALAAALGACGVPGRGAPAASAAPDEVARFWAGRTGTGRVEVASWPLYMDPEKPELARFTRQTGIRVNYREVIQEMAPWFAKVQPQLAAGRSIGYDLMILTNGIPFGQFRDSGFLAPLDPARLPNFARNAAETYRESAYDPGNRYSIPWASGITGIAYDRRRTGRDITSLADLWDPQFAGRVGMFADPQELANFGLFKAQIDPAGSTPADWERAAEELRRQKAAGLVRKYYEQDYVDALGRGEVWITQAWSGDIFQKNLSDGTDFRFVIPAEGGTIWTDNMTIPVTAANPVDALTLMDFFYDVEIAASLAAYINYVCPVPAARQRMLADAARLDGDDRAEREQVAKSPLVFPSAAEYAKLRHYVPFRSPAEQQQFQKTFAPIVLG